jgi:hypothetical protein
MEYILKCGTAIQIDPEDLPLAKSRDWRECQGYIRHGKFLQGKVVTSLYHRLAIKAPEGLDVDHRNGNPLDNRKENLRLATRAQNQLNKGPRSTYAGKTPSSRYKGVHWYKRKRKWQVQIQVKGNRHNLGYFTDELEAAKAYDRAALDLHGEFARLNFPKE